MIYYIRDEEESLIGLKYNDTMYYYIKNMQEDITGITDSNHNILCSYEYDSWGNIISIKDNNGNIITDESHIGIINSYRYRSYYYDKETKLYYLNSRYYNPEWGRFINADGIIGANESILGYNLYSYVENDFINAYDNDGLFIAEFINKIVDKVNDLIDKILNSKEKAKSNNKSLLSAHNKNKLPTKSRPNSTKTNPNGNTRVYGPDGKAIKDIDRGHPEHHSELENPHVHDWNWDEDKPIRGKARNPEVGEMFVKTTVTVGLGYLIYRGARMIPSLFPGMWWSIPANAVTP